jgi:hypothetical protein
MDIIESLFAVGKRLWGHVISRRYGNINTRTLEIQISQNIKHERVQFIGIGNFSELNAESKELGVKRVGLFFAPDAVTREARISRRRDFA